MGIGDGHAPLPRIHVMQAALALRRRGFRLRERSIQLLKTLGVPPDPRGIVLACGFIAAALFGLFAILTPPGDPIGWAYVGLAVVGYLFVQARIVTTGLWLLV